MTLRLVEKPPMEDLNLAESVTNAKTIFDLLPNGLIYLLANPYLAGKNAQNAIDEALNLYQKYKFAGTLDILGEDCINDQDCDNAVIEYKELITKVASINNIFQSGQEKLTVSFKPSMFSTIAPSVITKKNTNTALELAYGRIKQVVEHGFNLNVNLTLEAEDYRWTDFHLDTYFSLLNSGLTNLGTVVQTRLKRTSNDLKRFTDKSRVRLLIGIYNEPSSIAYTDKSKMKELMVDFAKVLFDKGSYVELASHDTDILGQIFKDVIIKQKIRPSQFETQYLKGVPRLNWQKGLGSGQYFQDKVDAKYLAESGTIVRLYLPYGVPQVASAYCKRRLQGNPNMIAYGIKNILGFTK